MIESIQFKGKDSVDDILSFIEGTGEFGYDLDYVKRGPRGMFAGYEMGIDGVLWTGKLCENEWLVKRHNKVVKLTNTDYQILFGETDSD